MTNRTALSIGLILAAATAVSATTAGAQGYKRDHGQFNSRNSSTIDTRQAIQQQRIRAGIRDGSLTRFEAGVLRSQLSRIAAVERRAKRDGRLDRRERATLQRMLDRASRRIFAERHDAEKRRPLFSRYKFWRTATN